MTAYGQAAASDQVSTLFRLVTTANVAKLHYDTDDKTETIYAKPGNFSSWYAAPENRELLFYEYIDAVTPGGAPTKSPLAKVKLPAGQGPFLVVLKQDESSSKSSYDSLVIDHSLEAHPSDSFRAFNFSKRRMAVRLADKDMLLATGQFDTAPYPDARKAWLKVAADNKDEGWLKVTSFPYAIGSDSRTTIFVMDIPPSERDPNPKGVSVRKVRERVYEDEFGVQRVR